MPHVYSIPRSQKRFVRSLVSGFTDTYERPCCFWKLNSDPLK